MSNYKVDVEVVLRAAEGRWDEILMALCPSVRPALEAAPNHCACPMHGGSDGFRFFKDFKISGKWICATCGSNDGLHLLMAVNHWSFYKALKEVNDYLQIPDGLDVDSTFGVVDGKVVSMGDATLNCGAKCFCLKISCAGKERSLFGNGLRKLLDEIQAQVGDNLRVCRVGRKTFIYKGKECHKTIWSVQKLPSDEEVAKKREENAQKAIQRAAVISARWSSTSGIRSTDPHAMPVLKYFENRGIHIQPGSKILRNVRFNPAENFYDEKGNLVGKFPCMVCAVRDINGAIITLHRTWLTPEGNKLSGYGSCKKLMALPEGQTINGKSIAFGELNDDGILCVAEGVETALSVAVATGYATLSTISANGMTTVELPKGTKMVCIFADRDKSLTGQKAAMKLRDRLLEVGVPSLVFLPNPKTLDLQGKGVDWNDVLRLEGSSVFPFSKQVLNPSVK